MGMHADRFFVEVVYPALQEVENYCRLEGYIDIECEPYKFKLRTREGIILDIRIVRNEYTGYIELVNAATSNDPQSKTLGHHHGISKDDLVKEILAIQFETPPPRPER